MRLLRRTEFIPEDIENRIIELDDFEPPSPKNEDFEINEKDIKKINDIIVNGIYIMVLSGLCYCFVLIFILNYTL